MPFVNSKGPEQKTRNLPPDDAKGSETETFTLEGSSDRIINTGINHTSKETPNYLSIRRIMLTTRIGRSEHDGKLPSS